MLFIHSTSGAGTDETPVLVPIKSVSQSVRLPLVKIMLHTWKKLFNDHKSVDGYELGNRFLFFYVMLLFERYYD